MKELETTKNNLVVALDSYGKCLEAIDLLENVWSEVGPYGHENISNETRFKLQRFFGFDDSE